MWRLVLVFVGPAEVLKKKELKPVRRLWTSINFVRPKS